MNLKSPTNDQLPIPKTRLIFLLISHISVPLAIVGVYGVSQIMSNAGVLIAGQTEMAERYRLHLIALAAGGILALAKAAIITSLARYYTRKPKWLKAITIIDAIFWLLFLPIGLVISFWLLITLKISKASE